MTMIPIELSRFQQREVALQARDGARAKGVGAFAGVISRFRGRLWFCTVDDDYGLAIDVTKGLAQRVDALPSYAFGDVDLSGLLDAPRPQNEVTIPLLAEEVEHVGVCAKLGSVRVKRCFIDAVRTTPGYVDARWFAPPRARGGAVVHAVVGDKPIAFISGLLPNRGAA